MLFVTGFSLFFSEEKNQKTFRIHFFVWVRAFGSLFNGLFTHIFI